MVQHKNEQNAPIYNVTGTPSTPPGAGQGAWGPCIWPETGLVLGCWWRVRNRLESMIRLYFLYHLVLGLCRDLHDQSLLDRRLPPPELGTEDLVASH